VRLYHFTCAHAAPLIRQCGELRPHPQVLLAGVGLVWLTDLDAPNRYAIGLTSHSLPCDRMAHRFEVDVEEPLRWVDYLREMPFEVKRAARQLAVAPGTRPMHWYVSAEPIEVLP
jgi:hypothetical protein